MRKVADCLRPLSRDLSENPVLIMHNHHLYFMMFSVPICWILFTVVYCMYGCERSFELNCKDCPCLIDIIYLHIGTKHANTQNIPNLSIFHSWQPSDKNVINYFPLLSNMITHFTLVCHVVEYEYETMTCCLVVTLWKRWLVFSKYNH